MAQKKKPVPTKLPKPEKVRQTHTPKKQYPENPQPKQEYA